MSRVAKNIPFWPRYVNNAMVSSFIPFCSVLSTISHFCGRRSSSVSHYYKWPFFTQRTKEKKQGRYVTCPKRTFIIFCSNRWPVSLGQKKYCRIFHFTAAATLCMYTHHTLAEHRNEFYKKLYYLHVDFKDFFSLFFRPARQKFQLCLHIIGRITLQAKVLLGKVCSSRNWFSEQDSVC